MRREVFIEGDKIVSLVVDESDNTKLGGGKLVKTTSFKMDKAEAKRQITYVEAGIKKVKDEIKRCKIAMSPEGRKTMIHLERQKLSHAQGDMKILKEHLDGYKKAMAKL
jgi:hypothetical protein